MNRTKMLSITNKLDEDVPFRKFSTVIKKRYKPKAVIVILVDCKDNCTFTWCDKEPHIAYLEKAKNVLERYITRCLIKEEIYD